MNIINTNKELDIKLYGKDSIVQKETGIIENLNLTGNEYKDRLVIQQCIDENNLKSDILYKGSTVYPFKKIVKAYRKLQKSGSLENLTNEMYDFFMNACDDIAHYSISGYKAFYNYSTRNLENSLLNTYIDDRNADRERIFKQLKIGKYFNERETINIDILSINKLKSIIKDCGWDVVSDGKEFLKLSKDINNNTFYSFNIDTLNCTTSRIMREISYITNSFNKESYIEEIVFARGKEEKTPTISEIVSTANEIKCSLNKLAEDVLYKCRLESEILMDFKEKEERTYDLDLELELG